MCVVTLLPITDGFLLTVNRDEHTSRPVAIPPQTCTLNGHTLVFPKDPQGGGTWLAASKTQVVCLLNGAFPGDKPRATDEPRKSRGLVVLDAFSYDDPYQFAEQYNFGKVEACTMIIGQRKGTAPTLFELRWNGHQTWLRPLEPDRPHIWSSVTLYDSGTMAMRKIWFTQFLQEHHKQYAPDALFAFHQTAGRGDSARAFVMNRPADGVRTVSLTQIAHTNQTSALRYLDCTTNTETQLTF